MGAPSERQLRITRQDLDRERLVTAFAGSAPTTIDRAVIGEPVEIHGEVKWVRFVPVGPEAGFEATVSDGTGVVVAAWPGGLPRSGVTPGSPVALIGTLTRDEHGLRIVDAGIAESPVAAVG